MVKSHYFWHKGQVRSKGTPIEEHGDLSRDMLLGVGIEKVFEHSSNPSISKTSDGLNARYYLPAMGILGVKPDCC